MKYLLSSWHEPIFGNQIARTTEEGIHYIERIEEIFAQLEKEMFAPSSLEELSLRALERLGIKVTKILSIVMASFEAHKKRQLGKEKSSCQRITK